MAFAPGMIVQLKSGSPPLTVVAVDGDRVEIVWFAEDVAEFRTQTLPAIALDELEVEEFDLEDGEEEEGDEDEDEDEDKH
ncbi:YodC family protein [Aquabacter spiritensis]|uniref:DUF2158 domain-containing protein n=1 Tax=Aquabacter spiritensis TaxID=933073 RepID=A0A4V2UX60_9HYPH|nr:DUF2158 domain-containing protein [Aquabacter spiritensis]TCT02168.1 hypothetical protein EDC64_11428 [Aquabacter spiritensis]